MYEYLVENLISYSQVDGNLRRTADRGLVSELYRRQMNALALKYFGVDSNGNYTENKEDIVAYRCPYSGEIISDLSTAHLEHILPVSSNGGTVLFNCIPILDKVNLSKSDEANLLVWWQEQNYFNYDRLERLIQYMLEAYTLAFKEPTEEELYDYDNSLNSDDYIENDDLSIDLKDKTSNQTNINIQQTITYYQLINDLINELSKNRDVSKYNSQLNSLKEQNTFGNIDELEKVINAVQTVFKETLGESSKSYLSYSLKIDMNKLLRSLDKTNYEQEIRRRFEYIQLIIKDNNISITDFFENLKDINNINLIYYDIDKITDIQKINFIENIKIGHKTKVLTFINMLSDSKYTSYKNGVPDENNILALRNKVPFEGYEQINGLSTSYFWHDNLDEILAMINIQKEKLEKKDSKTPGEEEKLNRLNIALKAIDDYNFVNIHNYKDRIEKFIEMLSNPKYTSYIDGVPDENNILAGRNKISFEGYEHINGLNTGYFWQNNLFEIIEIIYLQKEELERKVNRTPDEEQKLNKLNIALKAIDDHNFARRNNSEYRIKKFIEMLSVPRYTSYKNGVPDENNIFSVMNRIAFEGYEHINGLNTSGFWGANSVKIIENICLQKEELEKTVNRTPDEEQKLIRLNVALKSIDNYNFVNTYQLKIEKFIEMLSNPQYTGYKNGIPDENNILSYYNKISFEGYDHIDGLNTGNFWSHNASKIIYIINVQKEELERKVNRTPDEEQKLNKLNIALKAIDDYNFAKQNDPQYRIEKYIEMLSNPKYTNYRNGVPDENNILSSYNLIPFEGYEHIDGLNTSGFWSHNASKIIYIINVQKEELERKVNRTPDEEQKLNKLNIALKAIDDYNFAKQNDPQYRIEKYIEMLSNPKYTSYKDGKPDENNIFALRKNKIPFEGYEHINGLNTSRFWSVNSVKIIETISAKKEELERKVNRTPDEEQKLNRLNIALKAIDDYNFVNLYQLKIEKFIEMLSNPKYTNYNDGVPDKNNIFVGRNKIVFEGYEHINGLDTSGFWGRQAIKNIIPLLFYNNSYNDAKYDSARNAVMEYLNYNRRKKKQPEFKTIDEYIDTLDKTKKEVKSLIELRDSLLLRKQQLSIENQELTEELNSSYRRAM